MHFKYSCKGKFLNLVSLTNLFETLYPHLECLQKSVQIEPLSRPYISIRNFILVLKVWEIIWVFQKDLIIKDSRRQGRSTNKKCISTDFLEMFHWLFTLYIVVLFSRNGLIFVEMKMFFPKKHHRQTLKALKWHFLTQFKPEK